MINILFNNLFFCLLIKTFPPWPKSQKHCKYTSFSSHTKKMGTIMLRTVCAIRNMIIVFRPIPCL